MNKEQYDAFWERAESYNQDLAQDPDRFEMDNADRAEYESQLWVSDTGIMGSIDIPSLDVSMPIYHGTAWAAISSSWKAERTPSPSPCSTGP